MLEKLNRFSRSLLRAKKALDTQQRKLVDQLKKCETVDEIQKLVRNKYINYFKTFFLNTLVDPIYDAVNFQEEKVDQTYFWILSKFNKYLSNRGIFTPPIETGLLFDFDSFYDVSEDSDQNITHDNQRKECVKEVKKYAYVFNEEEGVPILEGQVSLWKYERA